MKRNVKNRLRLSVFLDCVGIAASLLEKGVARQAEYGGSKGATRGGWEAKELAVIVRPDQ